MALRKQLLSLGFVGEECRLDVLVHFLETQEIEQLEDLVGGPTLHIVGAEAVHGQELSFVEKVKLLCAFVASEFCCTSAIGSQDN